jgi:hypothetical protein
VVKALASIPVLSAGWTMIRVAVAEEVPLEPENLD